MAFPALLDTCTIFGGALNDLFLTLAETGTFRPMWSAGILEELERNLLKRGLPQDPIRNRITNMQSAFPDSEVHGYESLAPQMTCDENDRHVLAAAVRGDAAVLVTFNLRHFPNDALSPYDLDAIHPDEFLLNQLDLHPEETVGAVLRQADAYEKPPLTTTALLTQLAKAGVPKFAEAVLRLL